MAHPYLQASGPIAFAHRGGALDAPENSIEAFDESYALGYRWIETDAHLSADGVLVAIHDDDLVRVADRPGRIRDLTWEQISEARIEGSGIIPTIAELFDRFPDARFNIDTKAADVVDPLVDHIIEHDLFDRVCIGSFFDLRILRAQRRAGERLCTSAGPIVVGSRLLPRIGGRQITAGVQALQVPMTLGRRPIVTPGFVEAAHDDGLVVHVWTIDDPDDMHRLLDMGVDGIMTDRPQVLKDVLVERGLWDEPQSER